ncbi:MAG: magnesium transporter CorA family protein [Planctomycetia bacterium]|nr:magnesium transporter CorA family protein [Planctomycetia bacterium]
MITVYRWDGTTNTCPRGGAEQLPESASAVTGEDFVWIDLTNPTLEEEELIFGRFLKVHTLTLEDITRARREPESGAHFPKVEEFPDYLFVIVNPLPPGLIKLAESHGKLVEGATPLPSASRMLRRHRPQLSAVLTRNVLITHSTTPLQCIEAARQFLERHGSSARRGPDYVFHILLDAMVDEYAPVVDWIASRLDRLESRVFTHPTAKLIARILRLKRVVTGMRKTLILEREVLSRLTRGEFDLVEEREIVYYRNVYDHLVRYTELIEAAREMVSDLGETHLAAVSNRLNQIMKVLTMISTIVLPMTLITGVYGMNFEENIWPDFKTATWGFAFALALMAFTGIGALLLFRWRKWI